MCLDQERENSLQTLNLIFKTMPLFMCKVKRDWVNTTVLRVITITEAGTRSHNGN